MTLTMLTLPERIRCGRVAHAGGREGRSVHLVVNQSVRYGNLRRDAGDPLCRPASRFAHLNLYAVLSLSVAECCPQCLLNAVRLGILRGDTVRSAEQAYAGLRIEPAISPAAEPVMKPWGYLPTWNEIPVEGTPAASAPSSNKYSRMAMQGRRLVPHPEPFRASMDAGWFRDRVMSLTVGNIHRSPIVLRLPAPGRSTDRVTIFDGTPETPALRAIPIGRIGNDLVVFISAFEVVLRYHNPVGFPGGQSAYRETLSTWHRYPLTERARSERRIWRIEKGRFLIRNGASEYALGIWMFENASYISELLTTSLPVAAKEFNATFPKC